VSSRKSGEKKNDPRDSVSRRMADGSINEQSIWQYLTERNSADPALKDAVAVIDCTREYTYAQMF